MTDGPQPLFGFDLGEVRHIRLRDLVVRFAFGAVISVVAGVVGIAVGPVAGGAFLAFPAILPATLTLIEKDDGNEAAVSDLRGGVLGAVALELFALVVFFTVNRLGAPAGLGLAFVVWSVAALVLYVARARLTR